MREKLNLPQGKFSRIRGFSDKYVGTLEKGDVKSPTMVYVYLILEGIAKAIFYDKLNINKFIKDVSS